MASLTRARRLAICLLLVGLQSSCVSSEKNWSFGLSRYAYSGTLPTPQGPDDGSSSRMDQAEATGYLLLLALPLAIDLVLLPITLTRDLLVGD